MPDIWPSQLYMVIMICVALIVLPTQVSFDQMTKYFYQFLNNSHRETVIDEEQNDFLNESKVFNHHSNHLLKSFSSAHLSILVFT